MLTLQAPAEPGHPHTPGLRHGQSHPWDLGTWGPGTLDPSSVLGNMEALDDPTGSPGPLGYHFPVLNFKKERLGTQPAMTLGKRTGKNKNAEKR